MKRNHIIIGIFVIIFLVIILTYNQQENAGSLGTANNNTEAIQNIASVYADTNGTASFNNLTITGKINSPTQKFYMQFKDDGNLCIYDMSGTKKSCIGNDGITTGGNISTTGGNISTTGGNISTTATLNANAITTGGITTNNIAAASGGNIYVTGNVRASGAFVTEANVSAHAINLPSITLTGGISNGINVLYGDGKIFKFL
jgi:hypothetical protein